MTEPAPRARSARVLRAILLALAGTAVAALAMEGILRLTNDYEYQALAYDTQTGLIRYQPGSTVHSTGTCYDLNVHINNLGLYGPDIPPEKAPGTTRVVVVGSSFVEGIQVPIKQRFDTLATAALNKLPGGKKYEVVALGFPANGSYLNMLYYSHYMAALKPDVVIDLMTDYDLGKDAPTGSQPPRFDENGKAILELPAAKRNTTIITIEQAARQFKLFEALYHDFVLARASIQGYLHPAAVATETAGVNNLAATWDTEQKIFASFKDVVEESSAKFVVMSWSTESQEDRSYMQSRLAPILAQEKIPYLDLTPTLDQQASTTGLSAMLPCNGHWGVNGQVWVGSIVANYIQHDL